MSPPVELLIYERPAADKPPHLVSTLTLRGRTELGRQETTAESLYSSTWRDPDKYWRVVIARGTEQTIGRHHALVEPLPDGRLQLTNTSTRSTVQLENGPSLARGVPFQAELSAAGIVMRLGSSRVVRLQRRVETDADIGALPQATIAPEDFSRLTGLGRSSRLTMPSDPAMEN